MNDFISVMDGAEANNVFSVQQLTEGLSESADPIFHLPEFVLEKNYREVGFNLFLLRLPNVLLFILTLLGFFWWGKKLFGRSTILLTILVVASTFLVVPLSKFAIYDVWLLAFQLLGFTALILLLKQAIWKWRILFWIFTISAVFIEPKSALIFSFGMWLFLLFAHPKGKKLISFFDGAMWLAAFSLAYFKGGFFTAGSGYIFHYAHTKFGHYIIANLIGVLPWFAFFPAAIWDLIKKLKKREEMAIISFAFLLFSILSFGLVLQFALAFLIAKQLENYFKPNYPNANLVKSFAVLNLLFTFLLIAFLLLSGYDQFAEIGFRSKMRVGGVYWAFGFLAVIGLFAESKKMIVGGMALSGMLVMLLFLTQIVPLLENYRNLPQKLVAEIENISFGKTPDVYLSGASFSKERHAIRNDIYLKAKNIQYEYPEESDSLQNKTGIFLFDEAAFIKLDTNLWEDYKINQFSGRYFVFDAEQKIWILKR